MRLLITIPAVLLIVLALSLATATMTPKQPAAEADKEEAKDKPPSTPPLLTQAQLSEYVAKAGADSLAAAKEGIKDFAELATESNFGNFGFESLEEIKKIELGHPLPVVMVRLDDLKKFEAGDDPYKLLYALNKVVYPVLVDGKVRSGIVLQQQKGAWAAATYGISSSIRLYSQARERHAGRPADGDYFLLRVLSLNRVYLGHRKDMDLRLVRVRDQAAAEHKLEGMPAATLFVELAKLAKEHDGLPR